MIDKLSATQLLVVDKALKFHTFCQKSFWPSSVFLMITLVLLVFDISIIGSALVMALVAFGYWLLLLALGQASMLIVKRTFKSIGAYVAKDQNN